MSDILSGGTTPQREASGAPEARSDIAWITVQQLHELSGDAGRLKEAVDTLKSTVRDQGDKLDKINSRITLATGFVIGFGALLSFLVVVLVWFLKDGLELLTKIASG